MFKLSLLICSVVTAILLSQPPESMAETDDEAPDDGRQDDDTCSRLTINDCQFVHAARDRCQGYCAALISGRGLYAAPVAPVEAVRTRAAGCFSGDQLVLTDRHGHVRVSDLARDPHARVLTRDEAGHPQFSPVLYWQHKDDDRLQRFVQLTVRSGQRLTLTGGHLIYQTDCRGGAQRAIFAEHVNVGRCVFVHKGDDGIFEESEVLAKEHVIKRGIFSPITEQGNIVVSDMLASCHSSVENEPLQRMAYAYIDLAHRFFTAFYPENFVTAIFHSEKQVNVPEIVASFLDISKIFVR